MKKILYTRHAFHRKTKSNDFLIEMLQTKYHVEIFDLDLDFDPENVFSSLKGKHYDILLCFQIFIPLKYLDEYISFDKGVVFPMYDAIPLLKDPIWYEYKNFNFICFSSTLHNRLNEMGLSSYYIQYFPKPVEHFSWGDERSVFFWNRRSVINCKTVDKLLSKRDISHIHIHKSLDPQEKFVKPPKTMKNISYSTWYENKNDLLKDIEKSAIYIAPREEEGIGMSFLDAMAMGRCIIAPDNPTMNEYISHGKTGILYHLEQVVPLEVNNIRQMQEEAFRYIRDGFQSWEKNKFDILHWIEIEPVVDESLLQLVPWNERPIKKKYKFLGIPVWKTKLWKKKQQKIFYLFGFIPVFQKNNVQNEE